jgi:hypothetical protein
MRTRSRFIVDIRSCDRTFGTSCRHHLHIRRYRNSPSIDRMEGEQRERVSVIGSLAVRQPAGVVDARPADFVEAEPVGAFDVAGLDVVGDGGLVLVAGRGGGVVTVTGCTPCR